MVILSGVKTCFFIFKILSKYYKWVIKYRSKNTFAQDVIKTRYMLATRLTGSFNKCILYNILVCERSH